MKRLSFNKKTMRDYVGVFIGATMTAFSLDAFLVPNKIAAGGVSGLATVVYYLFNIPVGVTMLAINVPLFVAGLRVLGKDFGAKTLFGATVVSVMVEALAPFVPVLTSDHALAAVYGGVLSGIGIGITFRFRGSTGGTDIAARLIDQLTAISSGQGLMIIDFFVITIAGLAFNPRFALYALVALFVTSKVIDLVQEGEAYARAAFIISDHSELIAQAVLTRLDRGVTALHGKGAYTGREREVLLCIVGRPEIGKLKEIVREIDKDAFVIIGEAHEVLGEGFRQY